MAANTPRYQNVERILRLEITELPPNTLLPTELQYAKRFDVSRVTIRKAMEMLEQSGMISRSRGRGTIVCPPKLTRRFSPLMSFDQDFKDQGIEVENQVVGFEEDVNPPDWIKSLLRLDPETPVSHLTLLRLVDYRIISHDSRYFPPKIGKKLKKHLDEGRDITEFLAYLSERRASVEWESEIVSCYSNIAELMEIPPGALIVENSFGYYDTDDNLLEAGSMSYRIDRCKFRYEGPFQEPDSSGKKRIKL